MIKSFNVESVTHFNPTTGWFVAVTQDEQKVVGTSIIPPYGWITVDAKEEPDKYSREDGAKQWKCATPVKYDSVASVTLPMLASGLIAGISEGKAQDVFKAFGEDIWRILSAAAQEVPTIEFGGKTRNPMDLLMDAKGVGKVVNRQMVESWKTERAKFTTVIGAVRMGLAPNQLRHIIKEKDGYELFYKMLHNVEPCGIYDLVTYGIPWAQVDKAALENWSDKPALVWDDPIRLAGAVKFVLAKYAKEGQMCAPADIVSKEAGELIGVPNVLELIENFPDVGIKLFNSYVYTEPGYQMEVETAQCINQINGAPGRFVTEMYAEEVQSYADIELHPTQMDAIQMVLGCKVSIITGGPGTGKTTLLKVLADILTDKGIQVTMCAFMGSAARRMQIATGHEAGTIHRTFNLFGEKPDHLTGGYLFVDEMSTAPADLLYDFIKLVGNNVHLVFIGDVDQLPPVGRGEPFVQLLESNLPRVRLTYLFRNGGAIAAACRDVNLGDVPAHDAKDFFLVNKVKPEEIISRMNSAVAYIREQGWGDAIIITPKNDTRKAINLEMQQIYNPDGEHIPFTDIRVGDMVIQKKNNYYLNVRNGMVGECVGRTDDARVILETMQEQRKNPETEVPSWMTQNDIPIMDVHFQEEDHPHNYVAKFMEEVELGYAITAHKAQGNQFDNVIVVLPSLPPMLMLRQIVYTAMSRAKKKLIVLAVPGVFEKCIKNAFVQRRYSNLAAFISEAAIEMEAA